MGARILESYVETLIWNVKQYGANIFIYRKLYPSHYF